MPPYYIPVTINIPDINTQVYKSPGSTTFNNVSQIDDYLFFTGDGGVINRLNINGKMEILTPPVATRLTNIVSFKGKIYIGAQPGVDSIFESSNYGNSWTPVLSADAIGSQTPITLAANENVLVMGATGTVWRYTTDGIVWNTPIGVTASISTDFPNSLKWLPEINTFVVGASSKVISYSQNGINWTQLTMTDPNIVNVHTNAYFKNKLFLGTANGSIWTTDDFGVTVTQIVINSFYNNYGVLGATDFSCRDMIKFKNRLFSAQRNGLQYSNDGEKFIPVSISKNTFDDLRALNVFNDELWGGGNAGNIIKTLNK